MRYNNCMNTSPNYPYLSGYLQSQLKNLAYDQKFLKMKDEDARYAYVVNLIKEANDSAVQYAGQIGN